MTCGFPHIWGLSFGGVISESGMTTVTWNPFYGPRALLSEIKNSGKSVVLGKANNAWESQQRSGKPIVLGETNSTQETQRC